MASTSLVRFRALLRLSFALSDLILVPVPDILVPVPISATALAFVPVPVPVPILCSSSGLHPRPRPRLRPIPAPIPVPILCVCVVILFILDVRLVDVPAGVTQEEVHTGFLHIPFAVLAFILLARRIQPFFSLVNREVEFCVLTK